MEKNNWEVLKKKKKVQSLHFSRAFTKLENNIDATPDNLLLIFISQKKRED